MFSEDEEHEDNIFSLIFNSDEDDEESYIEIAVDEDEEEDDEDDDDDDKIEFQFRFSFSSLPYLSPMILTSKSSSSCSNNKLVDCKKPDLGHSSSSSSSSSSSNLICSSSPTASVFSEWNAALQKPSTQQNVFSNVLLMSCSRDELGGAKNGVYENGSSVISSSKSKLDGSRSRKTSKSMTMINAGFTKLFIIFRSINLRSILSLVKKSRKANVQPNKNNGNNTTNKKLMKKYFEVEEKSRILFVNLKTIKGFVEAMSENIIGHRKEKESERKNRENSKKSSPMARGLAHSEESRRYTRDNSVQAAISHCKKSYGVGPDTCVD